MRDIAVAVYLGLLVAFIGMKPVQTDAMPAQDAILFDIPAQPLADALNAYSEATGIELYYDGTLSLDRRSTAVHGMLSPSAALAKLLKGTGCVPRTTGPGAISIVSAPPTPLAPAVIPLRDLRQYAPYFALLQERLSQILCQSDGASANRDRIVFKFWVDALGRITHIEILNAGNDRERNQEILSTAEGLAVGKPPPADMPEPLIMAVYPPQAGDAAGCSTQ